MFHLSSSPATLTLLLLYLSGMCSGSPGSGGTSDSKYNNNGFNGTNQHRHHSHGNNETRPSSSGSGVAASEPCTNSETSSNPSAGSPNSAHYPGNNRIHLRQLISESGSTSDINLTSFTWNFDLPLTTATTTTTSQLSVRLKKDLTYISYDTHRHQQIYYSQLSSPSSTSQPFVPSFSTSVPSLSSSLPGKLATSTSTSSTPAKTKPTRTTFHSSPSSQLMVFHNKPPISSSLSSSSLSISASPSSSNHKSITNNLLTRPSSSYHQESLTSLNQLRMFEEKAIPKNITAQVGLPVYLHCIVEPIGDKMVSWIRLRDFHLLTVGLFTYSSDSRFVIRHGTLQPNDWALQIKHVTPKDEGLYECQVNTDPPRSQYFYLKVLVPYTRISGSGNDIIVSAGSTINLTCIISQSPNPPSYVFWYHNDRMINYDLKNEGLGQVSLTKDPIQSDTLISRLTLRNARYNSSGNYTCAPFNIEPSSIYLHVLQGAKQLSHNWPQNDEGSSTEYTSSNHGESNYKFLEQLFPFKSSPFSSCSSLTSLLTTIIKFFILLLAAVLNNQLIYSCVT